MWNPKGLITMAALPLALTVASCSRTTARLAPAPGVTVVPGGGAGASTTADGVQLVARAQAWEWNPSDLATKATPILLELRNDGAHPISVRYSRIWLTDADNHHFDAMPPYDVNGTIAQAYEVRNSYYGFDRFTVAPYLGRWYPRFSRFGGAFAYDANYYSPYVTGYQREHLPTVDMVQRALPEGVLEAGGHAAGFVHFQALHRDARELTLTVELIDATTSAVTGTAHIPFIVK